MINNDSKIFIVLTAALLLIWGTNHLQAKKQVKFPTKLTYGIYEDNQHIADATLSYSKKSGVAGFGKPLDLLKMKIYVGQEAGKAGDLLHVRESYIFSDTFSLYRESFRSVKTAVKWHTLLTEMRPSGVSVFRKFITQGGVHQTPQMPINILDQNSDTGKISSILAAARVATIPIGTHPSLYHYFSSDRDSIPVRIVLVESKKIIVAGRRIPVNIIAVTHNNKEIHRISIYKSIDGYCIPVVIRFDCDYLRGSGEMRLKRFPEIDLGTKNKDKDSQDGATATQWTGNGGSMTIEDVFRMISRNRFFCYVYGNRHREVLERLKKNGEISLKEGSHTYTFEGNWDIHLELEKDVGVVKSLSAHKNDYSKTVTLYWAPLEARVVTYEEAARAVDRLNKMRMGGYFDWRLPTLQELFYITGPNNKNPDFFPFDFESVVKRLWTSTSLTENVKKNITDEDGDIYFVIDRSGDGREQNVFFDMLDQEGKAVMLPVRSSTKQLQRIIGSGNSRLVIAQLPFMKIPGDLPMVTGNIETAIRNAVKQSINITVLANPKLQINNEKRYPINTTVNVGLLTETFFNSALTKKEKVEIIVRDLMRPNKIDLLVTGLFIENQITQTITIRPMVIYKYRLLIRAGNLHLSKSDFQCTGTSGGRAILCQPAARKIIATVKELLNQS